MRSRSVIALAGVLTLAALVVTAPCVAAAAPSTNPAPICPHRIVITALAFNPPTITRGQSSVVHVIARNCTRRPLTTELTWVGHFVGSGGGIPAGCPAIDPLAVPAAFKPLGSLGAHLGYLVFSGCAATGLVVTARFTGPAGALLAQQSTVLRITAPA
jgi:hypothetical protein